MEAWDCDSMIYLQQNIDWEEDLITECSFYEQKSDFAQRLTCKIGLQTLFRTLDLQLNALAIQVIVMKVPYCLSYHCQETCDYGHIMP